MNQELVRHLFDYVDGHLIWKNKTSAYSNNNIGKVAGSKSKRFRYLRVKVASNMYLIHRLVFLWHHGFIPEKTDHINRDSFDNRIENLRECTASQNMMNSKVRSDSKTGVKGVHWSKSRMKWHVHIGFEGKKKHLGSFESLTEAETVAISARNKLHGEFFNHG